MNFCKSMVKAFDDLPKIVKLIFALPCLDIVWNIYRVCRSGAKKNLLGIVLGVLLVVIGIFFMWLVDIITICTSDKVIWID